MSSRADVIIRVAEERDIEGIGEIVHACYGEGFFPEFYDAHYLKKLIFGDDALMLVAQEPTTARLAGIAAVLLEIGAFSDLVGEFGRLAVHPEFRHRGVASQLLAERVRHVEGRLHVGLMEPRVVHPYSVRNAIAHGFAPIGFLPTKLFLGGEREHLGLMVRHFGQALSLRRNHPRLIPEVHRLAYLAMENVGLRPDLVVDDRAPAYPAGEDYEIEELTSEGYATLLRIERGRVDRREIFGPLRLHYGFFKFAASEATYLIARRSGRIEGALGFTWDSFEGNVRVFEVIQLDDRAVRPLFEALERRCQEDLAAATVEVDVSAYAPRMQRTLMELGYIPAAYVPALAFHRVERLDVIKMLRVLASPDLPVASLPERASELASIVLDSLMERTLLSEIGESAEGVEIFADLTVEQQTRLAACFEYRRYASDERVFTQGSKGDDMYIVLEGRMNIEVDGRKVGYVEHGECLGEVSLLSETEHSASAVVADPVHAAVLTRSRLRQLVRMRPDIGVVLYRNLAKSVGTKLRRTDLLLSGRERA